MLSEMEVKLREEKYSLKKAEHDQKMKKFFLKETNDVVQNDSDKNTMSAEHGEVEMMVAEHPDDILEAYREGDSDVSEEGIVDLTIGMGGAFKELKTVADSTYISTWTIVLTASIYQSNPRWRTIENGKVKFDKGLCHADWRRDIKRFCRRMKVRYAWDFDDIESCLFEEDVGVSIDESELKEFSTDREIYGRGGGRIHGHILMQYNGNRRRGCQVQIVKRLESYMREVGWAGHWSTVYDEQNPRPLHHSRERQQSYVMISQYTFSVLAFFLVGSTLI